MQGNIKRTSWKVRNPYIYVDIYEVSSSIIHKFNMGGKTGHQIGVLSAVGDPLSSHDPHQKWKK